MREGQKKEKQAAKDMKWAGLEEKVTQLNLDVLWNFKGPETMSRNSDLKPGDIRLQSEPGKCQRIKALKPVVQKAQPSKL